MTAYGRLQLILVNIATLHNQFISHYDGRRQRQSQLGIFLCTIVLIGLGYGLDFHLVLFPQPGDNFSEMPSGLTAGFINKKSHFQHILLLIVPHQRVRRRYFPKSRPRTPFF